MALVGSFDLFGLTAPNAYAKVLTVTGGKLTGWQGQLAVYANPPEAVPNPVPTDYVPTPPAKVFGIQADYVAGEDALAAIYRVAATMPEFMQMVSDEPKNRITKLEFYQRFTQAEQIAIRTAAKSNVGLENYLAMVDLATYIDLARADTQGGVQSLEAAGLIGAGRAAEILTP